MDHKDGQPMDLALLEDFLELAREMNFSRAAENRNLTQPAFSRRIRTLESAIQTPLVVRTTRQVALTPAGKAFQSRAEVIVRLLSDARLEALEAAGQAKRFLNLAATHALSYTFVPRWLMQVAGPGEVGTLNMVSDTHRQCTRLMESGDVNFFICHRGPVGPSVLPERQFTYHTIGRDSLVPLCAPDSGGHPIWNLEAGLPDIPFISYAAASGLHTILESYWAVYGRPPFHVAMSSVLASANLEMAKEGQGVAFLPLSLAEPELSRGSLVRCARKDSDILVEVVIYRPRSRLSAHSEVFWQKTVSAGVM
ncbi:LysR family transcriptional regulator [Labrenzia sp. CP4]|jgi:DNA-binding transcriptional LysR family regulator|nr:LysR family transcriptional regulator [Labrenzia sp. CP4]